MKIIITICLSITLAACAQPKPKLTYIPPAKVEMCADKGAGGVVHISPCDPREVQK